MVFSEIKYFFSSFNNRHFTIKNLFLLLGIVFLSIGIILGYVFYSKNYNQKAFEYFSEGIAEYQKALDSGNSQDFTNAERAFSAGYKAYGRAKVSPFMLFYQADALLRAGNKKEALEMMEKALNSIPTSSPVYYLYATKLALIKLDLDDEVIRSEGRESLEKFSKIFNNPYKDMSSYFLGYQSWVKGDFDSAKKYWELLARSGQDSIWAALASSKLQLLN